jgi:lycopene cyclase domain-containing protein
MSTYLIVNLLALSMPLILSFDKRVHFYTQWKYLFPGIIFTMFLFIPWDVFFTLKGVWGFNPKHLLGIYFLHIPLEEWMFFVIVPYASLFTYEVLKAYIRRDYLGKYSKEISILLIILLLVIALFNFNKAYTSISFILTATCIFITQFILRADYMGRFYLSYIVVLIPFFVVNGILTGSFIDEEVVWYNNLENLSVRLFTFPVEDSAYGLLLILMNTAIYEFLKKRFQII